jgi:hypothetical protein
MSRSSITVPTGFAARTSSPSMAYKLCRPSFIFASQGVKRLTRSVGPKGKINTKLRNSNILNVQEIRCRKLFRSVGIKSRLSSQISEEAGVVAIHGAALDSRAFGRFYFWSIRWLITGGTTHFNRCRWNAGSPCKRVHGSIFFWGILPCDPACSGNWKHAGNGRRFLGAGPKRASCVDLKRRCTLPLGPA